MNDHPTPIAVSLEQMTRSGGMTAAFFTGATGIGHHWQLRSPGGDLLALTMRVHSGGRIAQAFWKALSATALDAGNDIHVELRGADDCVLARISSINDKPAPVTVTDPAGNLLAKGVRDNDRLTVYGVEDQALAVLVAKADGPWKVKDGAEQAVGELFAGQPGPSLTPKMSEWAWDWRLALNSSAGAHGMHLGLRRVMQYSFVPESPSDAVPVGVALLPLLAGLTY